MPEVTVVTSEVPQTPCHSPLAVTPFNAWKVRDSHGTNCVTLRTASFCWYCWKPTNLWFVLTW